MTIDDIQAMAYNAAAQRALKKQPVNPEAAIFRYWLAHKDVGVPVTPELELDDGSRAVVMSTGKVLQWTGGDDVAEL